MIRTSRVQIVRRSVPQAAPGFLPDSSLPPCRRLHACRLTKPTEKATIEGMKSRSLLCFLLSLLLLCGFLSAAQSQRPELRAFWADGFNPGFKSPQEVDELLQRLQAAHCNAIFAQMRKGGDAYYLSRYEPWAKDDQNHFDALAYLIQKAHALNPPIAVHAWINTCAVGGNAKNPFNILALHPDWLSLDPQNADFDGEASKIDPGHPDAADWTFRVYLDVARRYDVDGIHFDFV